MKASFTHIAQEIFRKKSIIVVVYLIIFSNLYAQTNVYDCNAFDPLVMPQDFQNNNAEYFKQCILFAPPHTYSFSGTSNKTIKAATEIHIKEGFHAGAYTGNGQSHLQIMPKSDFDVFVMNYNDLNAILKLKKFEIGIALPASILTKVNNFVNEDSTGEQLNPYLDWELRVYAEFSHASLSQPIVIDGFYTKEYDSWQINPLPIPNNFDDYSEIEYESLGGYKEDTTMSDIPFRVRFAPPKTGQWSCVIKIEVNQNMEFISAPFLFKVLESGNEGYVKVGVNQRYLRLGSKTFFPLGCNMCWPETKENSDTLLYNYLSYMQNNELIKKPEGYLNTNGVIPRVYDQYKEDLNLLTNSGANYYRSIMYPTSTEIEWEKLGDYTKRLHMAQEMDEIIEKSEQNGLYIHFNMQIHYSFQRSKNAYLRNWAWDSKMNGIDTFCYRKLIEKQYGTEIIIDTVYDEYGQITNLDTLYLGNPVLFLTDALSKKYYKQRLRYILARWGYSTNIAVWELFSEISNVGAPKADNSSYYSTGTNYLMYQNWQTEMAEYLKSMYHGKIHLVTASYAGRKKKEDQTFASPFMDIMTSNVYDFQETQFADFWTEEVTKLILNDDDETNNYNINFRKPLIFSETDAIDSYCDEYKIEWKRNVWQSVFSGLAGSLSWDAQFNPQNLGIYGQISDFIHDIDFDSENWHPGAVKLKNYENWKYKNYYAKNMDNSNDLIFNNNMMKADLMYMRSGDGNYAVGVLTNKTYNFFTMSDCEVFPHEVDPFNGLIANWKEGQHNYQNLEVSQPVSCQDEKLKLKGFNSGKYYFNYFLPGNYSVPIHSSDDKGPNSKIEYTLENDLENYIVPIKVRKKGYNWMEEMENNMVINENYAAELENNVITQKLIEISVYPNPFQNVLKIAVTREHGNIAYTITTNDGRIVEQNSFLDLNCEINTKQLQNGTYFLTLYTLEEVFIFKIIKI